MMASHQTFSDQVRHLSGLTKFDQTNLLYIINGEVYEFKRKINVQTIFSPYHKHCTIVLHLLGMRDLPIIRRINRDIFFAIN